jgi:membrane protein DedA with SNARE-associated domain
MGITEFLIKYVVAFISWGGYGTIVFLMALESMIFPVPSEAVLPFVGFSISNGDLNFWLAISAATLGSMIGSILSYYIGLYGGRYALKKWGKYLLLNEHHLEVTENFFKKRGDGAIFICRFIPIVRHLISIPAGMGKMNIFKFLIFTFLGAGIWNTFLTYIGILLGDNWSHLEKYTGVMDIIVLTSLFFIVLYFIYRSKRKKQIKK